MHDNLVVRENRRPGTRDWQLEHPAAAREIEGFASATSVARGGEIQLFVNTTAPHYTLEVFRMGWYRGLGARRLFGPVKLPGRVQPMPKLDTSSGLVDCAWVDPFVLTAATPGDSDDWPSGIYLARLTASGGAQSYIVFAVRDDERAADLLMQQSVTTYQAYNAWGGKSLYKWGSTENQRAAKVSFNRPYAANAQNPDAAHGMGAGEFLTNSQPHPDRYGPSNAGWEYNMVRWLECEGFDVSYCTNLDVHARPELLQRFKAFLSVGHDEYWSCQMRDHVEAARDAGIHLGFFSANTAYWQIRLEPSPASNSTDRILVCHKKAERDPVIRTADAHLATDKWRKPPINRPESSLIGVMYVADPVDGDLIVAAPEHWAFAGTGLARGDALPGLLGYEVDAVADASPANLEVLADSPWTTLDDKSAGRSQMTLYNAPSGALVFATGSIQWAWGLDDYNSPALRTARSNSAAQQITRNVLERFRKIPGA